MRFFEYPYVIITVLAIASVLMALVWLYFTVKSVRTAGGTAEKGFCGIGRIENDFEKAVSSRKNCCLVYISVSLDGVKRLYPESRAARLFDHIRKVLLDHFGLDLDGEIAHYGKNNFVALNALQPAEAEERMDACFEKIADVLKENEAVNIVQIHFGYHCTSSSEVSFATALSRAKQACSMAEEKEELHLLWDQSDGKRFEQKIKMENIIDDEIDNNHFFLEYQPIFDVKTEQFIGAEVLARLNSSTEGIVTPRGFLSAVNNVGLSEKFDYYIFEKNCKWISNDQEKREKYVYTINFSRSTFIEEDFAEKIIQIAERYGCDFSSIALEILEDKNLSEEESSVMIANLKRLKEKGILILLDDFGKGYTTFGDLADFEIDIVKIDKSITQEAENETGFLILKNIIKTAHDLGIKTLCEGIETEEHKKIVAKADSDMMQGYYFYRPMPVAKLQELFLS